MRPQNVMTFLFWQKKWAGQVVPRRVERHCNPEFAEDRLRKCAMIVVSLCPGLKPFCLLYYLTGLKAGASTENQGKLWSGSPRPRASDSAIDEPIAPRAASPRGDNESNRATERNP